MISLEPMNVLVHPACLPTTTYKEVKVITPPLIAEFTLLDEKGKQLQKFSGQQKSTIISWKVQSDAGSATKVSIFFDGKEVLGNLPLKGSIPVNVADLLRERNENPVPAPPSQNRGSGFTITVSNGRHEISQDFGTAGSNLRNFASLSFTTPYTTVVIERLGTTGTRRPGSGLFIFQLSRPSSDAVSITFTSSDPRVEIEQPIVVLPAGSRSGVGRIIARGVGNPDAPVATITARADRYIDWSVFRCMG
jgi:hypothetical protein